MRKRLILHVGPHKTASTYLQQRLLNRAKSLERNGFTYPRAPRTAFGHGAVVNYLRGWGDKADLLTEETFAELGQAKKLVLSSENFVLLNAAMLEKLRALFPNHDFQVVFMLRRLTGVLPSHWQETVKHGNPNTWLEYLARVQRWTDGNLDHVLPSRQLAKLAAVFGHDALRVISYDNALANGGDLFDAFLRYGLGLELRDGRLPGNFVNPGFPPQRIELLRSLNEAYERQHADVPGPVLRKAYMKRHEEIEDSAEFASFSAAFDAACFEATIRESDPFLRAESATVLTQFGSRILNRRSDSAILIEPDAAATVPVVHRNWVQAEEERGFVESLLDDLTSGSSTALTPAPRPPKPAPRDEEPPQAQPAAAAPGIWENLISLNSGEVKDFEVLGPAAEYRAGDTHTDWSEEGPALDAAVERDTFPLPTTEDREGYYGPHHFSYWASGHRDARLLRECCQRLGVGLRDYLDFGCASGRVIRHFAAAGGVNVTGCDINRSHVDWCTQYLPSTIAVFQNHSIPTLPLPDESQDVVSAYSVFTHLEAFDTTWLMELRRILRPGGIAWVTVHTEHTWQEMTPEWPLYKALQNLPEFSPYLESRTDLPHDRAIFRWRSDRSYTSNVFYTQDYLERTWAPILEIAEQHRRLPAFQDVVVLRKS